MCGILGFWGDGFRRDPEAALSLLQHRGPDDSGTWHSTDVPLWLGNTRLAVLDLSRAGHQPMIDGRTGNAIVLNGEIYNYRALRRDLERRGYEFTSNADTEVALKLFAAEGPSFATKLRGMFALAIWEAAAARLWLFRDRLGIKPLYCYTGPEGFGFASECRALKALQPSRSWRISRAGVDSYMALGSVSEPDTLWEGIVMMPPASMLSWNGRSAHQSIYWSPPREPERDVPFEEASAETRRLLDEAITLRTVADVPLGVFLSGGIDSSALAGILAKRTPKLRTLTVVMRDRRESDDEHARVVAVRLGTDHRRVEIVADQLPHDVAAAIAAQDQPSIDGVNTWIVSRAARQAGLTVALSGVGGDELFFGYDHFKRIRSWRSWNGRMLNRIAPVWPGLRDDQRGRLSAVVEAPTDEAAFPWMRALWSPQQLSTMGWRPAAINGSSTAGQSLENRLCWYELTTYLRNTLLRDTDVMSMSHGLEVRVPYLDHELVEYVTRLKPSVKWGPGKRQKGLLISAAADVLPGSVRQRRKKGFELPFDVWLRNELREDVTSGLQELDRSGILPAGFCVGEWTRFDQRRQHWSRIWQLYVLASHLQRQTFAPVAAVA